MTSSRINIEALTELIAASGHGPEVYYQSETPDVLAESLWRKAQAEGTDLILVPDDVRPTGLALVRLLDWDTRFFGYPCALIDTILARGDNAARYKSSLEIAGRVLHWCRSRYVRFVAAKLPGPDPVVIQALENQGFYLTNINLCLAWTGSEIKKHPLASGFRFSTEIDNPKATARTFKQLFYDGRFHNDPQISRETADRLWEAAVLNQLETEASDVVFIKTGERTVGLATIKPVENDPKTGILFVFGVLPEFRGHGLGKALLSELLERIEGRFMRIEVETSSFNLPAVRMYQRCGFQVTGSKAGLHWWSDEVE
jgi:ribosomal protein S18 acetylase RimI-like enzyme